MEISDYNLDTHKHLLASWAACRAANQTKNFRFKRNRENKKYLLNNLNDFVIQIDYFDNKGIKKYKNKIPLKYILKSKTNTRNFGFDNAIPNPIEDASPIEPSM